MLAADAADRYHRRAVRYFWMWLTLSTVASLAGNVVHAWLVAVPDMRWLAAGVAVVPPIVLLLAVHGLAVLARTSAAGVIYWCSVVATAALAVGAFLLSFVALRDLAVIAGIRPALAPVLPLVVDLAIAVSTLALVAIAKPAGPSKTATSSATVAAVDVAVAGHLSAQPASVPTVIANRDSPSAIEANTGTSLTDDATREVAAQLVAAKKTRQSTEVVARILVAHQLGNPLNRIAKDLDIHHSAVSRVIEAASEREHLEIAV